MGDDKDKNQDSRTQIVLASIGLVGTMSVALFASWDKIFIPKQSQSPTTTISPLPSQTVPGDWESMGYSAQGEEVSVDNNSIKSSMGNIHFTYKIGNEVIATNDDCNGKRWYASSYGWYSPANQATQKMLDYVCSF